MRRVRRKPTTAGLLAALLALFILTVGGGLWLERQQAERQGAGREGGRDGVGSRSRACGGKAAGRRAAGRTGSRAQEPPGRGRARTTCWGPAVSRWTRPCGWRPRGSGIRLTPAIENSRLDFRGMADAYGRVPSRTRGWTFGGTGGSRLRPGSAPWTCYPQLRDGPGPLGLPRRLARSAILRLRARLLGPGPAGRSGSAVGRPLPVAAVAVGKPRSPGACLATAGSSG